MSYEALLKDLADLEMMQKSHPQPKKGGGDEQDKKVQSATNQDEEEEGEEEQEGEEQNEEANGGKEETETQKAVAKPPKNTKKPATKKTTNEKAGDAAGGANEEEAMEKSIVLTTEDGKEVELVNKAVLLKALGSTTAIMKSMSVQIESLDKRVNELSGKGAGRKATITVVEKTPSTFQKSQPALGMTESEFFAKAFAAQRKGLVGSIEISTAETYLSKGLPIPAELVQRVLAAA